MKARAADHAVPEILCSGVRRATVPGYPGEKGRKFWGYPTRSAARAQLACAFATLPLALPYTSATATATAVAVAAATAAAAPHHVRRAATIPVRSLRQYTTVWGGGEGENTAPRLSLSQFSLFRSPLPPPSASGCACASPPPPPRIADGALSL